ncbi:hypothetical protein MJ1HA_1435 [Metallosphaera sedula]|nr:hypothetical protein MJ1HA_1435 [Metallosphaera sedula]
MILEDLWAQSGDEQPKTCENVYFNLSGAGLQDFSNAVDDP